MPLSFFAFTRSLLLAALVALAAAAAHADADTDASEPPESFVSLFDGVSFEGWTDQSGRPVAREGWRIDNGMMHHTKSGGSIVTRDDYASFDLRFEWKIDPGVNSGVKYWFRRYDGGWFGCEYQLIDDEKHAKNGPNKHSTGSLYSLYAPDASRPIRPAGEFNQSRIVATPERIEHWLNGQKILEVDPRTDDWRQRVAASKLERPGFAENRSGKIMLQDHGGKVWFRNLHIHRLDAEPANE